MLINSGVKRVVFTGMYPDQMAMDFFQEANVLVEQRFWSEEHCLANEVTPKKQM